MKDLFKIQNTKKVITELKDMFAQFIKSQEKTRSKHGVGSSRRKDYHDDPYSQSDGCLVVITMLTTTNNPLGIIGLDIPPFLRNQR